MQAERFLTEVAKYNWIVHPKPHTQSSSLGTLTAIIATKVMIFKWLIGKSRLLPLRMLKHKTGFTLPLKNFACQL